MEVNGLDPTYPCSRSLVSSYTTVPPTTVRGGGLVGQVILLVHGRRVGTVKGLCEGSGGGGGLIGPYGCVCEDGDVLFGGRRGPPLR